MDNLFFSDLGVGDGKNRLVKTKLHLVARAVFATIILSTPVVFAGSEYDVSKKRRLHRHSLGAKRLRRSKSASVFPGGWRVCPVIVE